jgi:hypothetical protein
MTHQPDHRVWILYHGEFAVPVAVLPEVAAAAINQGVAVECEAPEEQRAKRTH